MRRCEMQQLFGPGVSSMAFVLRELARVTKCVKRRPDTGSPRRPELRFLQQRSASGLEAHVEAQNVASLPSQLNSGSELKGRAAMPLEELSCGQRLHRQRHAGATCREADSLLLQPL
jgi:hypothetical protein